MDSTHSFGYWVRRRRRALDLTQGSLARQVGCALSMIRKIEADERRPSLQLAGRLAVSLAVPPAERSAFLAAARSVRAVDSLDLSDDPISVPEAHMPRYTMPAQFTSLIGREQEIAVLTARLTNGDARLVTVTGPGGIGKTRLAISAAAELYTAFPDGIWFIEFAPISDPALVPQTVASTLGLREEPGRPMLDRVTEHLRSNTALLILDNCEHLVVAIAQLAEAVLRAGPQMRVLATSREVLRITAEVVLTVPPLAIPATDIVPAVETLPAFDAVRLFVDRAAATLPGFAITAANAPAIASLCHALAGIPLAIELAAAHVNMLRVEEIAGRLVDMFQLLSGGNRTALPRQHTLQATMDWSYDLLTDEERVLLRRLSVFAGGWTLDAAEQVAGALVPLDEARTAVLPALTGLVSKSLVLVARQQGTATRYRLLEPIRQYARDKLRAASEEDQLRDRHLDYYADTAVGAEQFTGARQEDWLRRLEVEMDNVLSALDRALEHNVPAGLQLAGAVWSFCAKYGYMRVLDDRLMRLLADSAGAARTATRARALRARAELLSWTQVDRGHALVQESVAIYRELGNRRGAADGLLTLGKILQCMDGPATARAALAESLALYRALDDAGGVADALMQLSALQRTTDYAKTRAYLETALALYHEQNDVTGMVEALASLAFLEVFHGDLSRARMIMDDCLAMQRRLGASLPAGVLSDLGRLALEEGDDVLARTCLEECIVKCEASGDTIGANWAIVMLGYVAVRAGELERATTILTTAMHRFHETGVRIGVVYAVEGLASLAVQQDEVERAARLFGWADHMRVTLSDARPPVEQRYVDQDLISVRAALDEAAFATAWIAGSSMTLAQAMAAAVPDSHAPGASWTNERDGDLDARAHAFT